MAPAATRAIASNAASVSGRCASSRQRVIWRGALESMEGAPYHSGGIFGRGQGRGYELVILIIAGRDHPRTSSLSSAVIRPVRREMPVHPFHASLDGVQPKALDLELVLGREHSYSRHLRLHTHIL